MTKLYYKLLAYATTLQKVALIQDICLYKFAKSINEKSLLQNDTSIRQMMACFHFRDMY